MPGAAATGAGFGAHFQITNFFRPFFFVYMRTLVFKPFCVWRRKSAEMIKKWDLPGSGSTSAEFGAHFQRTNFSRPFISVLSPALDFKPFGSQTLRDVLSTPLPSILDSSVTLFVTLFSKGSNTRLDFVLLLKKKQFFPPHLYLSNAHSVMQTVLPVEEKIS